MCFNGATAMKPWKTSAACRDDHWPLSPLQWGHGDEAVEDTSKRSGREFPSPRFNGATAMKPWKTDPLSFGNNSPHSLQWGHGDEAVEDRM